MKPLALVPVAILFAGTAAFAATSSSHPGNSGTQKPAAAPASPGASPDGGNSTAAHDCPKGPHGVHGKCVSAAAHARNAARGHGNGNGSDQNEQPEPSETPDVEDHGASPAATPHSTASPHATPTGTPASTPTPTPTPAATPTSSPTVSSSASTTS